MKIGDKVRFKDIPDEPRLNGQTGIIVKLYEYPSINAEWEITLDNDVPGFYSGTAWASTDELEVLK